MAVARTSSVPEDFRPRVVSGLLLAVAAVGANYVSVSALAALVGFIALVMSWEWGRMVRGPSIDGRTVMHAIAVAGCVVLAAIGQPLLALALIVIGTVTVSAMKFDRKAVLSGLGVAYVGLPAVILVWFRATDTPEVSGASAILFLFIIVWTTDSFSYVCGKLIGGPRIWPTLSPGKTWAGTIGGITFAGLAGLVFAYVTAHGAPDRVVLMALVLSMAAQLGDLAELALKRAHNVKHVSQLIPGHGGFMDRMDGVVAAAIVAAGIAAVLNWAQPGHALLYWH